MKISPMKFFISYVVGVITIANTTKFVDYTVGGVVTPVIDSKIQKGL